MRRLAICAGMILWAAGATARGEPLSGASLPRDTRWVIHADVDGARQASTLWEMARTRVFEPRRADLQPKVAVLERVLGMKVARELRDVTLFGTSFSEDSVCIRIHGPLDKATITSFLRGIPEFQERAYNGHDILRWRDQERDRLMHASVATDDLAFLSASSAALEAALDTLDKKSPGLPAASPLLPPAGSQGAPIVWIAASKLGDLPRMQNVESPVFTQIDAASMGVRWLEGPAPSDRRMVADMRLDAVNPTVAGQLKDIAMGVKAFVALSAADEKAPPRLRLAARLLEPLAVQTEGKTVSAQWPVEPAQIESLINAALQDHAASPMTVPGKAPITLPGIAPSRIP